jgi:lysophospholipase L1-like esterase
MRPRGRKFQPAVSELEPRITLSATAARAALAPQGVSDAIVPSTTSVFYTPAHWKALHDGFVAQASQGAARVLIFGDSYAYFWGGHGPAGAFASQGWDRSIAPLNAANFGIIGDQTQNILWRVENGELAADPKVVVLTVGFNNLSHGDTPRQTYDGINAIVQTIHHESPGTRVLVLGVLPNALPASNPINGKIGQLNTLLRDHPPKGSLTIADVGVNFLNSRGQLRAGLIQPDQLHPTPHGYEVLTNAIIGPLRHLLATSR